MDNVPARIFLRPIGSPLAIGMSGLAIASFVQSGFDLHWVAGSQGVEVGVILLAVPFVVQLLAAIFSYLARDGASGTCTGVLSTSWLAIGVVHIVASPSRTSGALGLMLLASGGVLVLAAVAVGVAKPLPAAVFALAAARFAISGIYELSRVAVWQDVAGIIGLVVVAGAAYCSLAFELEGQKHGSVIPTMRRGGGESAAVEGAAAQLEGIGGEPGVSPTS
jgi:uncharacterized protein